MRRVLAVSLLATLGVIATKGHSARHPTRPLALPPLAAAYPLPPLPERSQRIANYTIEARLNPVAHTLDGQLVLDWRNTSGVPLDAFPFHLYWNAFRNSFSTMARGEAREHRRPRDGDDRRFGFIDVRSVRLLGTPDRDLTPTLRFLQPDDANPDDRTVMEVRTPTPVLPQQTVRFAIEWNARIPYGDIRRAGYVHDYHFIAQWFPKIGVFSKGAWNCHQFHATSEFFADYGNYDVRLTVPDGFVLGATGVLQGTATVNPDATHTFRFAQTDVHDFAWVASRRLHERRGRFDAPGYPPVEIRALVQPEHLDQAKRLIESVKLALRCYGAWSAPYPYPEITVVDPAWRSGSGGMEYPTLLTAGSKRFVPLPLMSPEGVTVHEAGHQFWYGLVGNNEFEEAWLDEGFDTYHTAKALELGFGPEGIGFYYFGPDGQSGWPVVAPGVWRHRDSDRHSLRMLGKSDRMARKAWEYRDAESYGFNSYEKPALTLLTLEGLVGDETMTRILRTYGRRFRFEHPTTADFIRTVNEVTGEDWGWFFDRTFFSSDVLDYAVAAVRNQTPRGSQGFTDGPGGRAVPVPSPASTSSPGWDSEVVVERRGEVRMPVEILVQFQDATEVRESWDGEERWTRYRYHRAAPIVRAVVDPDGKLALDIDPLNNSWVEERGQARRAATKWAIRFLLWLQSLLEIHTLLG